ncbi:MAG: hypothetical protein LBD43_01640 [Holosporales bacterium]|nr:hypothetical protein [Holosporales bacterium]
MMTHILPPRNTEGNVLFKTEGITEATPGRITWHRIENIMEATNGYRSW